MYMQPPSTKVATCVLVSIEKDVSKCNKSTRFLEHREAMCNIQISSTSGKFSDLNIVAQREKNRRKIPKLKPALC